jgi:hypothetical protein
MMTCGAQLAETPTLPLQGGFMMDRLIGISTHDPFATPI